MIKVSLDGDEIYEDADGDYVILSIDEYNGIVRQLNNLGTVVMELMTPENRRSNNFLNNFLKFKSQIVE